MGKLLGIGAILLGIVGVLLCAALIGGGWWAAVKTTAPVDRIAHSVDRGLSEVDAQLARVEARLDAVRKELDAVRAAAETIADDNPDLPRVRAEIERLLDRLVPTFDRADALADMLRAQAAALRTAADIVDELKDDPEATVRTRNAADKIERAAEAISGLRGRVEDLKTARAIKLTRELVDLARAALAGSELLAEGLAAARQEIGVVRGKTAEWRDKIVWWIHVAATVNTLVWLWGGLGQLCLVGWGRRRFVGQAAHG